VGLQTKKEYFVARKKTFYDAYVNTIWNCTIILYTDWSDHVDAQYNSDPFGFFIYKCVLRSKPLYRLSTCHMNAEQFQLRRVEDLPVLGWRDSSNYTQKIVKTRINQIPFVHIFSSILIRASSDCFSYSKQSFNNTNATSGKSVRYVINFKFPIEK